MPNKKIKVLHIIVDTATGGAETALYNLIKHSNTEKFEHTVISLVSKNVIGKKIEQLGISVVSLGISKYNFLWKMISLYLAIRKVRFAVVHCWMSHANLAGGICAQLLGIKKIWGIRRTDLGGKMLTQLITKVCAWCSGVIPDRTVYCAHVALKNYAGYGYSTKRASVIGNGFDLAHFKRQPNAKEALLDRVGKQPSIVIGALGRYTAEKDYPNLLAAIQIVVKTKADVLFCIAGRGVLESLSPTVEACNLKNHVMLFNEINSVDFLSSLDVFVLSSFTEGFPNVVGEAMCCELPCVVTDVGDAALIVGDNGIVVPPKNPEKLAGGVLQMLALSPEVRAEIGRRGRASIQQRFEITKIVKAYEAVYESLC
jgi:glycosyltransferase involved in cell wall biosynthesis